jgi:branched-chain amino acid transport system ATP-binding protein
MGKNVIEVEDLTVAYKDKPVLWDIDLTVPEGVLMAIIGPNGAGKTTLFNMISGTYLPTEGRITYEGQDITDLPPHQIAALGIARTFQIAKPFARLTVVDNVKVGSFLRTKGSGLATDKARQVVDFVGLSSHADRPAQTLTTAGRKRLELARALATEPKLLLLDEVMAGLTPTESAGIVNLIRHIREAGITILVIEHVMKAIMSLSDRVAVIHHGELIAIDPPGEVAKDPRVIEAYLGEEYQIAEDQ